MITSKEILMKARIGNIKTLTRWHQQGIIPSPKVRTHPSGHGKIAYWPDWVLGKCIRIRQLQDDGVPLREAAEVADRERLLQDVTLLGETPANDNSKSSITVGKRPSDDTLLGVIVLDSIRASFTDETVVNGLATRLKGIPLRKRCNDALARGGVPVLFGDAADLTVLPDFQVNHLLRLKASEGRCFLVLPLLRAIRELDKALGNEPTPDPDAVLQRQMRPADDIGSPVSVLDDIPLGELLSRIRRITRRDENSD